MTLWQFKLKKLGLQPRLDRYLVSKKKDGLEVLMSDDVAGLHNALTELAQHFQPGDHILTPEGSSFMLSQARRQSGD